MSDKSEKEVDRYCYFFIPNAGEDGQHDFICTCHHFEKPMIESGDTISIAEPYCNFYKRDLGEIDVRGFIILKAS